MNQPRMASPDEISPQELQERLSREEAQVKLLDVRELMEYEYCHLAHAHLIPLAELPVRAHELNPDDEIVAYCHHGVRSLQAVRYLKSAGFAHVKSLQGGIDLWSCVIDPSLSRY